MTSSGSTTHDQLGVGSVRGVEAHDTPREQEVDTPRTTPLSVRYALVILGLSVLWAVLMHQFGESPIYWIMGPYALVVCAVLLLLRGKALRARLRPTGKNVLLGIAMGTLMALLTYPAFNLAKSLFPELVSHVSELYAQSQNERLGVALSAVIVIASAEELLWRGAWYEAWLPRLGPLWAGALSVASYALTQFGSGSFIVALLALVCGTVWTLMRHLTGSLVPGLIAHLIWTPTVILLVPVTW
jgi:uncharacterized protein